MSSRNEAGRVWIVCVAFALFWIRGLLPAWAAPYGGLPESLVEPIGSFDASPYGLEGEHFLYQEVTDELYEGKTYKINVIRENGEDGYTGSWIFLEIVPFDGNAFLLDPKRPGAIDPVELRSFVSPDRKEIFLSTMAGRDWDLISVKIFEVLENGTTNLIFSSGSPRNDLIGYVDGEFWDDYKVHVTMCMMKDIGRIRVLLDLSDKKEFYQDHPPFYKETGKLLSSPSPDPTTIGGIFGIMPCDYDEDGLYELKVFAGLVGANFADSLCVYEFILKYRDGRWQQIDEKFVPEEGVRILSVTREKELP